MPYDQHGEPKGLIFRSVGLNMFVAEFASQRDYDRVWEGSLWHVSKHAVILSEFDECMRPSELQFNRLQVWIRAVNLLFNLRNDAWRQVIAKQIDKQATAVTFDHASGFLRVSVTLDVTKPLRQ